MSRVMTYSRHYPGYHPKAGDPTFFVEKILEGVKGSLGSDYLNTLFFLNAKSLKEKRIDDRDIYQFIDSLDMSDYEPKGHTCREGNRWKVGHWFSPRIWSGKPYRSKQIIIAPDIQVKKVWKFELKEANFFIDGVRVAADEVPTVAKNDGLSFMDFMYWFRFPQLFTGQIIGWNEKIEY